MPLTMIRRQQDYLYTISEFGVDIAMMVWYKLMLETSKVACIYVTGSTKTVLYYRQVLRKVGLNYLICCSSPMTRIMSMDFSHIM